MAAFPLSSSLALPTLTPTAFHAFLHAYLAAAHASRWVRCLSVRTGQPRVTGMG